MNEELDVALAKVQKAQSNLVVDPEVISGRCDTMLIVMNYLDSRAKGLLESNPETRAAFSIYKASHGIFMRYITVHDQVMFDAANLEEQNDEIIQGIKSWQAADSAEAIKSIEDFDAKASAVYVTSTEIMRDYMGVVNQYHKKKIAVHKVYDKLRRLNMEN